MADKPLLPGDGYIQKLLNQLPQDDREFVLQLLAELGLTKDPGAMPFFIVFQYYLNFFKRIPAEMQGAARDSLKEALTTYGKIQAEIDQSIGKVESQADRVESEVDRVEELRKQFVEDVGKLLPLFGAAFDKANQTAAEAYEKTLKKLNKASEQALEKERSQIRNTYLKDVLWQGFIWAGTAMLIAMIFVGGVAYWGGNQRGQTVIFREVWQSFGGEDNYNFARELIKRSDNIERIVRCQNDNNDKCTLWIADPPQ